VGCTTDYNNVLVCSLLTTVVGWSEITDHNPFDGRLLVDTNTQSYS